MQDNFEIPNYNDSIMLQKQIVKGHGDTGEGGHGHAEKMVSSYHKKCMAGTKGLCCQFLCLPDHRYRMAQVI